MTSTDVVAALDIGGTHVTAGRVDLTAGSVEPGSRVRVSLPAAGVRSELLAEIFRAASSIARDGVSRVGVAVPGPFDYSTGVSRIAHKLQGLYGVDLRAELCEALRLTDRTAIHFLNDAEAFLLGEWWVGAARGHARVVGVTLGTGLGSAFLAEGRIVRTGTGVPPGGALYELPFRGAPVEQTISSSGLLAHYGASPGARIDVEEVAARARTAELAACRAFEDLGRALGEFLSPWLRAFEPGCLVVGGSIACAWELFEGALRAELEPIVGLEKVTVAEQLDDAPLLGAAWHVAASGSLASPGRLHPRVEAIRRERLAAGVRPLHLLSVAEAREADLSELGTTEAEPVAEVVERMLPGPAGEIPARLYLPEAERPLPVLVYFSGGGWVLGSLESADAVCRRLANAASCAVVSVAYRRAPENQFPAGLDDCYAATCWVAEHGPEHGLDASRIAVVGVSAGGNLAAAAALLARARGGPRLALQLLVYPPLDHRAATESMRARVDPPFFSSADVRWCWSHYLADPVDGENPLASPLRASDLRGLPPALVITAGLDPLRDEAELYAARLQEANVPTEVVRFDGVMHGFFSLSDRLDAAAEAQALAASALRRAFEPTLDDATI